MEYFWRKAEDCDPESSPEQESAIGQAGAYWSQRNGGEQPWSLCRLPISAEGDAGTEGTAVSPSCDGNNGSWLSRENWKGDNSVAELTGELCNVLNSWKTLTLILISSLSLSISLWVKT